MKKFALVFCIVSFIFLCLNTYSQYAPPAGQIGSTAIAADSSCFISWAQQCAIHRGYVNVSDTSIEYNDSNIASYGEENWAIGQADNQVVSLGDAGYAILQFNPPIANGTGWDFAVFENSLNDNYLELAFVEVSTDGINYFRFPATSLTQTETQTATFGTTDATKINNLAGKYRALFGTPFNIDNIEDNVLLDKNNIRFVKIIDVVGSINTEYGSVDIHGLVINDPWPTPFNTCGFDLDAVGVINNTENTYIKEMQKINIEIFPNPSKNEMLNIESTHFFNKVNIYSINGQKLKVISFSNTMSLQFNVDFLTKGLYILKIEFNENVISRLLVRQ